MDEEEVYEAQAEAAKQTANFIDMFDAPGVASAAERMVEAARVYAEALSDAGLPASDAIRATVGLTLKALLP